MPSLEPLSSGEKMLNQRLLAEGCMTERRAEKLWKELHRKNLMEGSSSLQESLTRCNAQLELANLEVVGCVFSEPNKNHEDDDDENDDPQQSASSAASPQPPTKYVALIHKHTPDDNGEASSQLESASKIAFKTCLGGRMAMNHRRAMLAHLVEHTTAPRSTLINLKNDLKDNANYELHMAETCVDSMVQERWLVAVGGGKGRRVSMQSHLALGPRSFMELSDMLTEQFGLEESQLPQQLFYR